MSKASTDPWETGETLLMRLLTVGPRIRKQSGKVIASSAWRVRLVTLDAVFREVIVDPKMTTIRIRTRYFWCLNFRKAISFAEIQAVAYGSHDLSPESSFSSTHDGFDCFSVGLRLVDDAELTLFRFYGEGSFTNNGPFPDWMYWGERAGDLSGNQEYESRLFVDLLSTLVGVEVVPAGD